eukprot:6020912-Alexandrium_andersonii.AAC.1
MCRFGTPWGKAIRIAAWSFPQCARLSGTCRAVSGERYFFHRCHFILAGQDEHGQWRTARAQAYPTS